MFNIMRNIFNVVKYCFVVCFLSAIILFCLNKVIFGLNLDFLYYMMLGAGAFIALSAIILFIGRKGIFVKGNVKTPSTKSNKNKNNNREVKRYKASEKTARLQKTKKTTIRRKRKIS